MAIYLTTAITIKDMAKMQEYAERAIPTIDAHGGESVVVGQVAGLLCGDAGHQLEAVFRFPDKETVEAWYRSPGYQDLIPLRDEGADVVFKIIEEL